ncbi:MAG TPA: IPT/TIG domain-containing protein [Terriglobia bacterium]|nr:IPT/TIG domain-containing protein [Terriglobia bacterium]
MTARLGALKHRYIGICMAFVLGLAAAGCGGGSNSSSQSTTQQTNPVPSITSVSPSSATAGAAEQTLTITGANFVTSSTATYNGVAHTVTYVSSAQLTLQLSASDQATAGSYPVVVTNPAPGGGASNAVDFLVSSSTAASGAIAPSFFSMTVGFTGSLTWPPLPIGTLGELTAAGWANVEPSQGQFDWSRLDDAISVAQANGATTINYNMHTTPAWAAANPGAPCTFSFLTACSSPPTNIDDWNNYVTALVTRYKGKINYYELWDEPDYTGQWSGTIQQLLTLAQSAYGIIKSIDPDAQVLTPGVTVSAAQPITNGCGVGCWLASYLQAGGAQYADGVTFHGFYCQNGTGPSQCPPGIGCDVAIDCAGAPLLQQISYVRAAMNANGLGDKLLFDTSGGWGKDTDLPDSFQQEAYVARWYILQAAAGVKIADWWGWDVGWGTLGTNSSGLNAAGQAYTVVNGWLVGATATSPCALSGSIWTCGFSRPNGYEAQIVWSSANSSDSATSPYTPPSQFTRYRDLAGNTTSTTGASIDVGMQPIIFETGPPPS